MTKLRAVVDPSKSFESSVFGASDLLRFFPELRAGGTGVLIERDGDDDFYYIIDEERGIQVNDSAFFNIEELGHLILTDENGTVVHVNDSEVNPDIAEIPGVIRRGSLVRDTKGYIGVVVRINTWGRDYKDLDDEHHGELEVWLRDEVSHGGNNCDHYTLTSFQDFITVLEY